MLCSLFVLNAILLASYAVAAPTTNSSLKNATSEASQISTPSIGSGTGGATPTASSSAPVSSFTAGLTSDDPNYSLLDEFENKNETPEAIRGSLGGTVIGPQNIPLDRESPDFLAPPSTDAGYVKNSKWPFSLSTNRLATGGWARQKNIDNMPIAEEMAGVDMKLEAGAIRELHWHTAAEWGYVLQGTMRITAINADGQNYEADVAPGDLWYFPAGMPHSLQATNDTADGSEFLLVFDTGNFNDDDTFLLTDWVAHIPKEVLAKNFQANISAFDHIPAHELYIFPSAPPPPVDVDKVSDPQGTVPEPYSFALSQVPMTPLDGGSVRIVDSTTFKISKTIAVAEVTVNVGAMREIHWHPTQAEWSYFISGQARMTIFAANGNANTFDYVPGDVGYVPPTNGHYVENMGNETLHYLEIFKTDKFQDISLNQWLALTPPELVKAHLNIDDATVALFNKTKQVVVY